ncbi:hypothetical protein EV401DRAFT_2004943 [Pisolithus croceorrhizus]|nr:hypothetical protein EV401DRAFT_2004943 [Pisolithus croceorrhizus]
MIQRRLAWPLHKDDTLFRSGRPTGLNIDSPFSHFHSRQPRFGISIDVCIPRAGDRSHLYAAQVPIDHIHIWRFCKHGALTLNV